MTSRPLSSAALWCALVVAGLLAPAPSLPAQETASEADPAAVRWLELVEPILLPAERDAYLALRRRYQRDAFEKRFWQVRDPYPESPMNEFATRWLERAPLALERWGTLADARALAFVVAGEPVSTLRIACPELLAPAEIWTYAGAGRLRGGFSLVFVAEGMSSRVRYRAWKPREGIQSIATPRAASSQSMQALLGTVSEACSRGGEIASLLQAAADWDAVVEHGGLIPQPGSEWVRTFALLSTDLPANALPLAASLELRFPDRRGLRTVTEGVLRLEAPPDGDSTLHVDGEILRDESLFDQFRYRFRCPAGDATPFAFERLLRPGSYRLVLRLHDLTGERYFREERDFVVPVVERQRETAVSALVAAQRPLVEPAAPGGPADGAPAQAGAGAEADTEAAGAASVRILLPGERLVTGKLRVEAAVRGDDVAAVAFSLDGRQVLTKQRPPYGVELDFGRAPRLHRVGVRALGRQGQELARDEAMINGGPHRFGLRLVDPRTIPAGAERVTARVAVEVPEGETLDRVEFFVNDQLHATLYQEPFVQPLPLPGGADVAWIRAVGYLADGGAAEDVRLIGGGEFASGIEVDFVELYASVLDRRGRPIEDLTAAEVEVLEGDRSQEIRRLERVADLPIHAAVLLDTSASMAEELDEAERAALRFFNDVLTDRDRAAVMTFADEPRLAVRFSGDVEVLAGGLADLEAAGETRLYDAVAFALHYFSGIRGKRALVVLSDGLDSGSRFSHSDVLEYARRTGVAIYVVGLNVPSQPPEAGMAIDRLARETGGRAFRISRAVELGPVYREIERELRAQYLIAYQSSSPPNDEFREIEVRVSRPGVELRTARGYYP